jgi:hypothetical protein
VKATSSNTPGGAPAFSEAILFVTARLCERSRHHEGHRLAGAQCAWLHQWAPGQEIGSSGEIIPSRRRSRVCDQELSSQSTDASMLQEPEHARSSLMVGDSKSEKLRLSPTLFLFRDPILHRLDHQIKGVLRVSAIVQIRMAVGFKIPRSRRLI